MWDYRGSRRPPFAVTPGPDQESVWDYPRPPLVSPDRRSVAVRSGGRRLAESSAALRVLETASPPTFYLPASDVDLARLVEVAGRSFCEWKGAARYWTLRGEQADDAVAWDYPQPTAAFADLLGHFAFYPGRAECLVDGQRVRAQAGGFYGGWVTDEIVGPFKGETGTGQW